MSAPATVSCPTRALVDGHFGRGLSAARERTLRAHLPGCDACRAHYERHLLLAELDPRAPSAKQRLARGLGLRATAPRPVRAWASGLMLVATAACAALLVLPRLQTEDAGDGFTARGGTPPAVALPAALQVYRALPDGRGAEPVTSRVRPDDALAFAYRNPLGMEHLLVFGVDEAGSVYWYHPAWTDAAQDPQAVPARPGGGPHELPEAVRHRTDGRQLTIYTLLSQRRIDVQSVEDAIRRAGPTGPLPAAFGAENPVVLGRSFVVQR